MIISVKLLILIVICLWIYYLWSRRKFYLLTRKIPGPLGYPIIGMAHKLAKREAILQEFGYHLNKYGPVIYSWLGPFPFLVISDPQIAQDILTSPKCINKAFIYEALDDGTGRGLFSLKNPKWSLHRKLLNPAFGRKVLLSFFPIFNKETNGLLKAFEGLCNQGGQDLTQILQNFTLTVATLTTMGKHISINREGTDGTANLLRHYQCVLETMTQKCFAPWLSNDLVYRIFGNHSEYTNSKNRVRDFVQNLINEKMKDDSETTENNIFINIAVNLMKQGNFDWKDVIDESNVIVFGAFETTANTLAYTLIMLALFPLYQEKVFEEIVSIFPEKGLIEVSDSDVKKLVYLDMVLNETMRVMAPVPVVARECSCDVRLSNGVVVPEGVQIAIDIFHMHRRKDIWGSDAHLFNPDNFLPSNIEGKHSFAFIPFTKGIRNCIGWKYGLLSAKVVLTKLLRNFRFQTNFRFEDLYFVEDITIKLREMPLLEIHRRHK